MKKKRGKAKAGVTMNYSEDEKSEDGTSSDEENLRTPALVEENSKLEVGFEWPTPKLFISVRHSLKKSYINDKKVSINQNKQSN